MKIHPELQPNWAPFPVGNLQGKLGRLSEMNELESLRLQMAMDRLSKLMSTLSNMLKKAAATGSGLVENQK